MTPLIYHLSLAGVGLSKAECRQLLIAWMRCGAPPEPSSEADGASLVEAARREGLAGLLAEATAGSAWPRHTAERLRSEARLLLARGAAQLDAAARAVDVLARAGLRCLPLKGAAVAETLYSSVACRPMSDVDLLALDDWRASVATMQDAGFEQRTRAAHALGFEEPASGVLVELHRTAVSCGSLFPVDREGLWQRCRTDPGRQVERIPSSEDLAVLLSLHTAFQHSLRVRLVQLLDLERLVEDERFDSHLALDLARRAGAETVLAVALEAAAKWTGARIPDALREALAARLRRALRAWLDRLLGVRGEPGEASAAELALTRLLLVPGRRLRLIRESLAPTELVEAGHPVWRLALGRGVRLGAAMGRSLCRRRPSSI